MKLIFMASESGYGAFSFRAFLRHIKLIGGKKINETEDIFVVDSDAHFLLPLDKIIEYPPKVTRSSQFSKIIFLDY
jgi:hypothetical protein